MIDQIDSNGNDETGSSRSSGSIGQLPVGNDGSVHITIPNSANIGVSSATPSASGGGSVSVAEEIGAGVAIAVDIIAPEVALPIEAAGEIIGVEEAAVAGDDAALAGVSATEEESSTGAIQSITRDALTDAQQENLERFESKIPANSNDTQIFSMPNGTIMFQADFPAANIPGSFARYEKIVDSAGQTVGYNKTVYGTDGAVMSIKNKAPQFSSKGEKFMVARKDILRNLVAFNRPLPWIIQQLSQFPWDSEPLLQLRAADITSILNRYLKSELTATDVEDWANAVEGRDDLKYQPDRNRLILDSIHELANPLLTKKLSFQTAQYLIDALSNSYVPATNAGHD